MKFRTSFVTNSSSSNYMIMVKKEFYDSLDLGNPLIRAMHKLMVFSFQDRDFPLLDTIEKLNEFVCYYYGYDTIEQFIADDDQYDLKWYQDVKSKIENGFIIFRKEFDHSVDGEGVGDLYRSLDDGDNIIVDGRN